jgi:Gluconate 2-dehydrogenase subunit 3
MKISDTQSPGMSRREAVWRIALLMGGAMVGSEVLLSGQTLSGKKASPGFSEGELALLDGIGDTIIPETQIPGAKAVQIGAFMAHMVSDCYNDQQDAVFRGGLAKIDEAANGRFGRPFLQCTPAQRTDLANALETEQRTQYLKKAKDEPVHYFRMMKELTVLGYFSSEIGCTQAVRYIEVPGAYHGDIPYKKGDMAWF